MRTTRTNIALAVHAAGWAILFATVLVVRTAGLGDGWLAWLVSAIGVLVFAVSVAWSAAMMLDRVRSVEATSQSRVVRSAPAGSGANGRTRQDSDASSLTWDPSGSFGATVIRRRGELATG